MQKLRTSKVEFIYLFCLIEYESANIQLLDLPGIIEGAAQGKGRGRQVGVSSQLKIRPIPHILSLVINLWFLWKVIAVARTADLVLMILDATKPDVHRNLLEKELVS